MKDNIYKNKSAEDLFPALFDDVHEDKPHTLKPPHPSRKKQFKHRNTQLRDPNKNWLRQDRIADLTKEDSQVQKALTLSNNKERLLIYKKALNSINLKINLPRTEAHAIELISANVFSLIIYENRLKLRNFEQFMRNLAGEKRRNLYYVIIGSELKTLYDLEALSLSANLVVNSGDVQYLHKILQKGLLDYETLYRPFIDIFQLMKNQ